MWISPSQRANLGDKVTLSCTATGRPTPRVVWKKNGQVLLEKETTANLTISSISQADGGIYECSAINIVANDTRTTAINIEGKNIHFLRKHFAGYTGFNSPFPSCS